VTNPVPPGPGTTLHLTENQYKFGVGPLLCRVRAVIAPVEFDGALWWHLDADCAQGTPEHHGGWTTRELYVPATAIPRPRPTPPRGPT
jgi:hypothetical protein